MPNLNPKQFEPFVESTNATGGATLHVASGNLIGNSPAGPHGYIVGGEPNRTTGRRVKTRYVPKEQFTPETASKIARGIKRSAKPTEDLGIGSWLDKDSNSSNVEMDAVSTIPSLKSAMETARARGEKAVWSTKLQDSIYTDKYFENPKKYHDMVGEPL